MRLSKIKLAGFKSFVDPTTIPLPSNLVGIVGPNGCGKSNVIDAVRWVMGESSAKHLRGDSMADVIFNGSNTRKPVGQAAVELVFDNSDGMLGGQYAQYSEISTKRVVSRDGTSQYYLNGTRCRRRDITDIFLGTGLGPRSYSIIEQGMISRLIEAKPEDLRIFIEEAAGISKYKERRRETENRIRHTRDNMSRLNDLRDELEKQLEKLKQQSKTAEKYKELKTEERLVEAELTALRWRILDEQHNAQQMRISDTENNYQARIAEQRGIEAEMERQREQSIEASDAFNGVQGNYYALGADIARVEQSIQHLKDRRREQEQDLQEADRVWRDTQAHLDNDQQRISAIEEQLQAQQPSLQQARAAEQVSAQALQAAEEAMQVWQGDWDEFNQQSAEQAQQAQVERTRIQHLEQQILQAQQRIQRLGEEAQRLAEQDQTQELQQRSAGVEELRARQENAQARLQALQGQIAELRETGHRLAAELDEQRSRLQAAKGRFSSLEALQQAALGKTSTAVMEWLNQHGLGGNNRLAENLDVDTGWERAVECVLGQHLEAVCSPSLDSITAALEQLQQGSLAIFATDNSASASTNDGAAALLRDKVRAPWSLENLLGGVYVADTLADALALRSRLGARESVITRDGVWLGKGWLRVVRDSDERSGVIQREHELKTLALDIRELSARIESVQQREQDGRAALRREEEAREQVQEELQQAGRQLTDHQSRLSGLQARQEQMRARREAVNAELAELRSQHHEHDAAIAAARSQLETATNRMSDLNVRREELSAQREQLRGTLETSRTQAAADRGRAHEIALRVESLTTELTSTRQGLQRMESQLTQNRARREELQKFLTDSEAPLQEQHAELETLLERRVAVEAELTSARQRVDAIEHELRELNVRRTNAEQQAQDIRAELDQLRLAQQELKVRRQTLLERIEESGHELNAVIAALPEDSDAELWAERLEKLAARIQRLGPINLAAIDEYQQQQERKEYLDSQHADLTVALETLENAIRKIDRETRTRFKETFDKINDGLKNNFPRLFGGGHAYLELTGEDLLDTGVSVMARPPGKRNSSIHLLSGGEKALTAVALVFSIFNLNPAPFCMLDEVDAPLDDANVGRFCDMVKDMSEQVQFIFITHNKITMEISHQLNGVTMQEPGVSRLVAVDIDEAAAMAVG